MYTVVPCNGNVDWNARLIITATSCSGRSLQWERGLKLSMYRIPATLLPVVPCNGNVDWNFRYSLAKMTSVSSFPAMGTWIEIYSAVIVLCVRWRRSLQWERGLKLPSPKLWQVSDLGRSLQWERGLKYCEPPFLNHSRLVVPCNGNVDWNDFRFMIVPLRLSSFPAMGTWIEMPIISN